MCLCVCFVANVQDNMFACVCQLDKEETNEGCCSESVALVLCGGVVWQCNFIVYFKK